MDFEKFTSVVEKKIKDLVGSEMRVELHTNLKNNGEEKVGLVIREKIINIAPTIYLEDYFELWKQGKNLDEIVKDIWEFYQKVKVHKSYSVEYLKEFEQVKDSIVYKLINQKDNELLLKDTPHIVYLDLAYVFYILIEAGESGTTTMLIKQYNQEMWGVSTEELFRIAESNTCKVLKPDFQTMTSVISELLEGNTTGNQEEFEEEMMYVLTNKEKSYGAVCLLYPHMLETISEKLQDSFYVIPSSIHEVIIVPMQKGPTREELDEMICDVNSTQLDPVEILSNHAYYYTTKEKRLLY